MLHQQETVEPETSEVIRLAQQLYERDRAIQEKQTSLEAAAEEMGLPREYLRRATAQLEAKKSTVMTPSLRQQRKTGLLAMLIGLSVAFFLLIGMFYLRSEVISPPASAIVEPQQISEPETPRLPTPVDNADVPSTPAPPAPSASPDAPGLIK